MESNNVRHDVPKGNLAWTWLGLRLIGNYTTLANCWVFKAFLSFLNSCTSTCSWLVLPLMLLLKPDKLVLGLNMLSLQYICDSADEAFSQNNLFIGLNTNTHHIYDLAFHCLSDGGNYPIRYLEWGIHVALQIGASSAKGWRRNTGVASFPGASWT